MNVFVRRVTVFGAKKCVCQAHTTLHGEEILAAKKARLREVRGRRQRKETVFFRGAKRKRSSRGALKKFPNAKVLCNVSHFCRQIATHTLRHIHTHTHANTLRNMLRRNRSPDEVRRVKENVSACSVDTLGHYVHRVLRN